MSDSVSLIIGICGGTGSGKTTVANRILETVSGKDVVFIQQDSYYRNLKDCRSIIADWPTSITPMRWITISWSII